MLKIRRTGAADYSKHLKVLICGEPGAGKTLISSTFPNPLFAATEPGLMSIADRDIPFAEITESSQLLGLKNTLDQEADVRESMFGFPVDTIVIDTIDALQAILTTERLHAERKSSMQMQDWGWLGEQMKAIVTGFRNLDMNVVFTCHLKETNDDTGKVWSKPGLQGQIADQIAGHVDLSLVLDSMLTTAIVDAKPVKVEKRVLLTSRTAKYPFIKDRSGKLPTPDMEVNFHDDYARMHELVYAGVGELKEGAVIEVSEPEVKTLEVVEPEPTPVAQPTAPTVAVKPVAEKLTEPIRSDGAVKVAEPEAKLEEAPARESGTPRNKMPDGIKPEPKGYDTDIYCVQCGGEVESEDQAQISKIRFREILDLPCYTQKKR